MMNFLMVVNFLKNRAANINRVWRNLILKTYCTRKAGCLAVVGCIVVFCSVEGFCTDLRHASLQRGARIFMNYCAGCHSLKYLRYNQMAEDIGLVSEDGQADLVLLKNNLIFTQARPQEPIEVSMPLEDARQWFGVVPPDLSLIARQRSPAWISAYLQGFYPDSSRPFGTNNHLFPDVAMPDILGPLLDGSVDALNPVQRKELIEDLVNFLSYVSEPVRQERERIGVGVIVFLLIILGFVYCLTRSYLQNSK